MTCTITTPAGIAAGLPDVGAYFACLAAYNSGRLHGAWVDLELISDAADLQECIDYILSTSPVPDAEEWAMHDSAGLPYFLSRTEWPSLADLAAYGESLYEIKGEDDQEAFRLWCENVGQLVEVEDFREAYLGPYDSEKAYCQDRAEETGALPGPETPWPLGCIDWEAAWRELETGGDCVSIDAGNGNGVHIFRSY